MRLHPSLVVSELFDDNIFATRFDTVSDYITILSPFLSLESDWSEHELRFHTGADIGRHANEESENYNDFGVGGSGRYDFGQQFNIFGGVEFSREHEPRDSPDDVAGAEPTTFKDTEIFLGTYAKVGRLAVRPGVTFERIDFDDVPAVFGEINNDDRDRRLATAGARVGYEVSPGYEAFVQGSYDNRQYFSFVDDFGFNHDSDGFRIAAGARAILRGQLDAEIFAGFLKQTYEDARFSDVSGLDFGARLSWAATPATTFTAFADRTVEETTVIGASSYLLSRGGLGVEHYLDDDLRFDSQFSVAKSDFQGRDRADAFFSAGAGLRYFLTRDLFLGLDYEFRHRDSTVGFADYDENLVFLRLGGELERAGRRRALAPTFSSFLAASTDFSGFYAGAQVGYGGLSTKIEGARGLGGSNPGRLEADFGDLGATWGGFGGYGIMVDDWYFGAEAEAGTSSSDWGLARTPAGRFVSVNKRLSYGGAARIGYALGGRALLYGRVGLVRSKFDIRYTFNGVTVDNTETPTGVQFGGGIEIPVLNSLFLRFDYTYTNYDDYKIAYVGGVDRFDTSEDMLRLGLGYRFNMQRPHSPDPSAKPHAFSGFYAGGQGGYGALASTVEGPRGGAGNSGRVMAEFADHGATWGGFAGYGKVFDGFYVGIEGEGEMGHVEWDHARLDNGRIFSVRKRYSFGGSARVGYALPDLALFYGRVGAVRTQFDTGYLFNGVDANRSDTKTGLRFGGGVEVPIAENVFLRFDYTHTSYDDYLVDYRDGVDSFDNSESLFRLGVAIRF